jgi:hypothetical protein
MESFRVPRLHEEAAQPWRRWSSLRNEMHYDQAQQCGIVNRMTFRSMQKKHTVIRKGSLTLLNLLHIFIFIGWVVVKGWESRSPRNVITYQSLTGGPICREHVHH